MSFIFQPPIFAVQRQQLQPLCYIQGAFVPVGYVVYPPTTYVFAPSVVTFSVVIPQQQQLQLHQLQPPSFLLTAPPPLPSAAASAAAAVRPPKLSLRVIFFHNAESNNSSLAIRLHATDALYASAPGSRQALLSDLLIWAGQHNLLPVAHAGGGSTPRKQS
ncbi:hypothetical protein PT974_10150 [Cladobotryum mycophilum]|uniref:Uncharacterized protein n=1 Tax=Cladobotryum mycophilum TaxID=491253 RepID=A0ABR0S924_9HYPO